MAESSATEIVQWVQAGGVLAFAGAVMWELRQLKPLFKQLIDERQADRSLISDVKIILSALLERERIRDERRRRDSDRPQQKQQERTQAEWPDDESTGLSDIMERQRRSKSAQTPGGGVRSPRPGTHHDE